MLLTLDLLVKTPTKAVKKAPLSEGEGLGRPPLRVRFQTKEYLAMVFFLDSLLRFQIVVCGIQNMV
ncbi:hypothetical protein J2Y59_003021 [Arcicella sp. BE139]|nr:hypothetical protein [Arcicella sp. BE51]MDR6824161.1 hypothetical protein [Arcicella sp. BE139]